MIKFWDNPQCEGCCFRYEPASAWYRCDYCNRNPEAIKQEEDMWRSESDKNIWFDSR